MESALVDSILSLFHSRFLSLPIILLFHDRSPSLMKCMEIGPMTNSECTGAGKGDTMIHIMLPHPIHHMSFMYVSYPILWYREIEIETFSYFTNIFLISYLHEWVA